MVNGLHPCYTRAGQHNDNSQQPPSCFICFILQFLLGGLERIGLCHGKPQQCDALAPSPSTPTSHQLVSEHKFAGKFASESNAIADVSNTTASLSAASAEAGQVSPSLAPGVKPNATGKKFSRFFRDFCCHLLIKF